MTTEIEKLENQLMLMGFNGMAYTSLWNEKAKRLNELKSNSQQIENGNSKAKSSLPLGDISSADTKNKSLGIKDSSSTKNEIHSQQEEFSTCEKVKNSVLTPADTIHSKNKELMDNDYKDLEEKIENCPNCECKFKTGEHDVEMCKYLNR